MESMRLTPELLKALGFRAEGKVDTRTPAYRLHVPRHENGQYYMDQIQVTLRNFPDTNPNSGIVYVYSAPKKDLHFIDHEPIGAKPSKFTDILHEEEGRQYGIGFFDMHEKLTPIAYRVTTLERLNAIYCALTDNPPLVPNQDYFDMIERVKQRLDKSKSVDNGGAGDGH